MNRKEFFEKLAPALVGQDDSSIAHAYWFAKATHRGQTRDEGERYFEHCRRVALILIEFGHPSVKQVNTALLHDCDEDGFLPEKILEMLFGREVAEAVSVLSNVRSMYDGETGAIVEKRKKDQTEYFQAIATAKEWVREVKLADRLDNIQTMSVWPQPRIEKYLRETEEFILPIALATNRRLHRKLQEICDSYHARH